MYVKKKKHIWKERSSKAGNHISFFFRGLWANSAKTWQAHACMPKPAKRTAHQKPNLVSRSWPLN